MLPDPTAMSPLDEMGLERGIELAEFTEIWFAVLVAIPWVHGSVKKGRGCDQECTNWSSQLSSDHLPLTVKMVIDMTVQCTHTPCGGCTDFGGNLRAEEELRNSLTVHVQFHTSVTRGGNSPVKRLRVAERGWGLLLAQCE